jgi:tRNA A-37 threonylcarbamoyl transferase component Bud32
MVLSSPTVTLIRSNKNFWEDELECYKRLNNSKYIPKLISSDELELSITTSFVGPSLFQLKEIDKVNIVIEDPMSQLKEFIDECEQNRIIHLDFHPGNILLKNKRMFFIDFEKVIIDDRATTAKAYKRYQKFLGRGGWNAVIKKYKEYFENFDSSVFYTDEIIKQGIIKYGKALQ